MTDPIPAWPGELVALGADEVFVRSAPAADGAEPALFVHGLGGSSQNWTDLMGLLREPAKPGQQPPPLACQAVDLPGFGYSPPPASGDYTITARANAVIALLDKQQRGPVHLVGNSLGGAVCTRVAARRPDLVLTLTLISPALPDLRPRTLPLRLTVICLPGVGPWLMTKFQRLPAEVRSSRTIRDVFGDPSLMHPQRRTEEAAELIRRDQLSYAAAVFVGSARSLVAEYTRVGRGTLWRDAARVAAPALVIHGSHDRLVHPAMAGRAARAFRSGRAVVLPGVGHVAMMERPDLVAGEMRTLLAGAADRPAGPADPGALAPAGDARAS
ncbi:MAG TPA: alpha/beta hydrolase [Streptosporangiaceae bacterium]|jgi:pimeloyl-ACP methyl ester carboxylesterase